MPASNGCSTRTADPSTADAPQVVNNSWSGSAGGCDTTFAPDLAALRAAGILPVFAAGNDGPAAGSVFSPANLPDALAVGGVDDGLTLDPYSSRGPSACPTATSPALVAPDTAIRTTDLFGGYVEDTGTSVAAPHVSGGAAVLLSAMPGLTVDRQSAALEAGAADLGPSGPDDDAGHGLLDLTAAYEWASSAPDFSVSLAPSSVTVAAGQVAGYDAAVTSVHGFGDDVSLTLDGLLPGQATWSFSPATVVGGTGTAHLEIATDVGLPSGVYPLVVRASSGPLERTASATLIVTASRDFGVTASRALVRVPRGGRGLDTIATNAVDGFLGDVTLSASGFPSDVGTVSVAPSVVSVGSPQLQVSVIPTAAPGSYSVIVEGSSGSLRHSTVVTVVVPPDFDLSVSPTSQSVPRGQAATFTVTISAVGPFAGRVSLAVRRLPLGTLAAFSAPQVTVPGTSLLTIRTTAATPRRTKTITVVAACRHRVHRVPITLTVV